MNISNFPGVGTIWTNVTRTLTSLGSALALAVGGDNSVIANGTTVSFQTSVGIEGLITVVGIAAANVTFNVGVTNGTNFRIGTSAASAASIMVTGVVNSFEAVGLSNSGTVSGNYSFAEFALK